MTSSADCGNSSVGNNSACSSSRLSIIQEQIDSSETSNGGQVAFDDLRRDYKDAIQCIVHCESLIKTLESQLTTKDDIISSLEEKIIQMSLELASAKANEDELQLIQRRQSLGMMDSSIHSAGDVRRRSTMTELDSSITSGAAAHKVHRPSWSCEDDDINDDDSYSDEDYNYEEDSLGGVEDGFQQGLNNVNITPPSPTRKEQTKDRRNLGARTMSTPINSEPESSLPKAENTRAFAKSLPGGIDSSLSDKNDLDEEWESARENPIDDSTSSRGILGLFTRQRSGSRTRRRSSTNDNMDTSHSDREGLDESTSSRGWGGLFQRKPRRDSRKEVEDDVEEPPLSFEAQMNDIGNPRRGMSKARVQRQQSNRNFLSAVCFPDEEEDLTKGLNERSFVKQLKELKEHDEKEAARRVSLKDSSRSLEKACGIIMAEEANLALANDNMTAVQRTIARREAMKKRRAMQAGAGRLPQDRGMAREGSSWY